MYLPIAIALLFTSVAVTAAPVVHHRLQVDMDPASHHLAVTDTLTLPTEAAGHVIFELHAGLAPVAAGEGVVLDRLRSLEGAVPLERYRLTLPPGRRTVVLHYSGAIDHPLTRFGEGVGQRREGTAGTIGSDGVFLSGLSAWYPTLEATPWVTFELTVALPPGWRAVSQGTRDAVGGEVFWRELHPQDDIYLVANRFHLYQRPGPIAEALVYLRQPDDELADRYLDATHDYLRLYSALMGDYPYAKFALVENFWETGYGMPSFTLLGPRVIKLPFIIGSSYPHEIVHNWWGNGVHVAYERGNWSEGLSAYMADHLLKEREGEAAAYRRDQLQQYAAYVHRARDFPLEQFTARHSGSSQAIGYGKGMMLFHMLRRDVGDERFLAGLRRFYREWRFRRADFDAIRAAFETESGEYLAGFFDQWLTRPSAPRLRLAAAEFADDALTLTLAQDQPEPPFRLTVPLAIGLADGRMVERTLPMGERSLRRTLSLPGRPVCVTVDPRYDLFRRLLPGELPVSVSTLLGAERLTLVLPAASPEPLRSAYRELAAAWAAETPGVEVVEDAALPRLPSGHPVWLLGWENRFRDAVTEGREPDALELAGSRYPRRGHGFVLTAKHGGAPLAWLAADQPAAIARLARKVPHYGKYGYLVFEGPSAENRLKGQWATSDSPLTRFRDRLTGNCRPPPHPPLARFAEHPPAPR